MHSHPLSIPEAVLNIIENVACRLAERWQGRITPPHLMPYVPLYLEVLRACLDDMVDDESVLAVPGEVGAVYQFSAYRDLPVQPGALSLEACVACGTELLPQTPGVLCPECLAVLHKAGERAARLHGWAPQARLEHALLYAATQQGGGPVSVATLASRSHTRMRVARQALEKLALDGYIRQEADINTGAMVYTVPPIAYPRALYQANAALLKSWGREARGRILEGGVQRGYNILGGAVLLGGLVTWYFTPSPPPPRPLPRSALVPLAARPEPPSAPATPANVVPALWQSLPRRRHTTRYPSAGSHSPKRLYASGHESRRQLEYLYSPLSYRPIQHSPGTGVSGEQSTLWHTTPGYAEG